MKTLEIYSILAVAVDLDVVVVVKRVQNFYEIGIAAVDVVNRVQYFFVGIVEVVKVTP